VNRIRGAVTVDRSLLLKDDALTEKTMSDWWLPSDLQNLALLLGVNPASWLPRLKKQSDERTCARPRGCGRVSQKVSSVFCHESRRLFVAELGDHMAAWSAVFSRSYPAREQTVCSVVSDRVLDIPLIRPHI